MKLRSRVTRAIDLILISFKGVEFLGAVSQSLLHAPLPIWHSDNCDNLPPRDGDKIWAICRSQSRNGHRNIRRDNRLSRAFDQLQLRRTSGKFEGRNIKGGWSTVYERQRMRNNQTSACRIPYAFALNYGCRASWHTWQYAPSSEGRWAVAPFKVIYVYTDYRIIHLAGIWLMT